MNKILNIRFMIIKGYVLHKDLESSQGRSENRISPDVIANKGNTCIIIPSRFREDIDALKNYIGRELTTGIFIELSLEEMLEVIPRKRRRKDAYDKLVKFLADEMNVIVTIKSKNYGKRKID